MRLLVVAVLVVLAACNDAGTDAVAACPIPRPLYCTSAGVTCMADDRTECRCDGSTWFCSTCGDLSACLTADRCDYWGFEVDCSCGCNEHGVWRCSSNDPNHGCPYGADPIDAGIDAP